MIVKLLGYAPDGDPSIVGILTGAAGVIPTIRGLKGAPSPVNAGMATLQGTCQGAALITKIDGTNRLFAGTGNKLYEAGSSTWSDVSRAATYTAGTSARWRFAQQGNVSFAANGADTVQGSVSTGAFSCVAGAPIAALVETVGKFVFAANTTTDARQIRWSALNDYTSWSASITTQAGSDTLTQTPDGITAIRAFGSNLIVYKKNSMYQGVYVGAPNIWEFNLIPGTAGALSQEVVVNVGTPENPKHLIMGEDDFYLYDGSRPLPIGEGRIKQEVFGALFQTKSSACTALHDKANSIVRFYWPSVDSVFPDKCRVYNYKTNQWGIDDRQIEAATDFVAASLNYNGAGSLYATYNDLPTSTYGSAFLGSTQKSPGVFDTAHVLQKLIGVAGSTSFSTGDFGDDVFFTTLTRVRPRFITTPTAAQLTHFYKMNSGDSLTVDTTASISNGAFDVLLDARWHRVQFMFTGDWELSGFSPEWIKSGTE